MIRYLLPILAALLLTGCSLIDVFLDDAVVASRNLSKAADNFEINRRIVFYNGITSEYMLSIEGKCALENLDNRLAVTCMIAPNKFKKHFLGLSDNVTYFAEQLETADVSRYHYRVTFKPQIIVPDIDFKGSTEALKKSLTPDSSD